MEAFEKQVTSKRSRGAAGLFKTDPGAAGDPAAKCALLLLAIIDNLLQSAIGHLP